MVIFNSKWELGQKNSAILPIKNDQWMLKLGVHHRNSNTIIESIIVLLFLWCPCNIREVSWWLFKETLESQAPSGWQQYRSSIVLRSMWALCWSAGAGPQPSAGPLSLHARLLRTRRGASKVFFRIRLSLSALLKVKSQSFVVSSFGNLKACWLLTLCLKDRLLCLLSSASETWITVRPTGRASSLPGTISGRRWNQVYLSRGSPQSHLSEHDDKIGLSWL